MTEIILKIKVFEENQEDRILSEVTSALEYEFNEVEVSSYEDK